MHLLKFLDSNQKLIALKLFSSMKGVTMHTNGLISYNLASAARGRVRDVDYSPGRWWLHRPDKPVNRFLPRQDEAKSIAPLPNTATRRELNRSNDSRSSAKPSLRTPCRHDRAIARERPGGGVPLFVSRAATSSLRLAT